MADILVVDDDKNLRELYQQELSDDGHAITLAADGPAALTCVRSCRPDLVILDIAMPGMNGLEVLEKIMALDKTIPVILNSAYSGYKDNFTTWTADAYVVKSGDLTELKATIKKLLDAKVLCLR